MVLSGNSMRIIFMILLFLPFWLRAQWVDTLCIKCIAIEPHSNAVGYQTKAKLNTIYDQNAVGGGMSAWGVKAQATAWRALAVGDLAIAGSVSSTAIGYGAVAIMVHGIAIGRGAYLPLLNKSIYGLGDGSPIVIGSTATEFGIGNWWGHKFRTPPSGIGVGSVIPSQTTLYYHGQDAYDDTTNEINIAGGHIGIAAGRGTGTGIGGEIRFYTAPPKNLGGNTKNPLVLTERITANGHIPLRLTTVQINALTNIVEGTIVYDLTKHTLIFYNGTAWICTCASFQ
jgi:hypothetical protein